VFKCFDLDEWRYRHAANPSLLVSVNQMPQETALSFIKVYKG